MALYTYKENVDQRDRTAEISFDRTDGSRARLIKGKAADLTADEVGRLSKYIVLEAGGASSDVQPLPQSVYTDPTTGRISPSLLPDVPRAVAGDTLPRPSGVAFPFSIVAPDPGPGAPNRYNSFPGQVLCANGEWLVTYRQALTHNVANPTGTTESILLQQRSRDLNVWSDPVPVYTTPAHYDARDPCLYREPGSSTIYMTWCDIPAVGENGPTTKVWITKSEDHGRSWLPPRQIVGASNTGMPLRRNSDGKWRLPFFQLFTINQSWVAECTDDDPYTGTWTTRLVMSHATKHRNEWDFTEAVRPKTDRVNAAAGYDNVATAIVVDTPTKFQTGITNQQIKNRRTGEVMTITGVDVPTATLTVTRGANGSTAQAINDNDILSIYNTLESVWVAAFRNSAGSQLAVSESTDEGVTWAVSVEIQTISAMLYDGWPCPVTFSDDSVGIFVRGTNGLRLVQCLDLTSVMDPAAWAEPAGALNALWRPLDYIVGTTGIPVGKFQPVRVGDVWYGAYYIELDLSRNMAEVRFGVFNERDLRAKQSYIATAQKIPDASPGSTWQQLATPDTVMLRTKGGKFKVLHSEKSNQASGTISSYQVDVMHTGRRWVNNAIVDEVDAVLGNPIRRAPESATRLANSGTTGLAQPGWNYYDEGEGVVELGPGVHTFKLVVQQANTAVGRTFSERKLRVEPL
jgi:hypothetical protein